MIEAVSENPTAELRAAILNLDTPRPVVVKRRYGETSPETLAVKAAADLGVLFLDGLADGIWIDAPGFAEEEIRNIELMILQAARITLYKGRTVVERNIPQEEALDRLVELIRDNGDWVEP